MMPNHTLAQNEGSQRKTLKVAPSNDGFFLSASMTLPGGVKRQASVPIAHNEMMVLKTIATWSIPRLMGFDMLFEGDLAAGAGGGGGGGGQWQQ